MMRILGAIRRFFAHLLGFQKPLTPGAIARMRLEELKREHSLRWEIRPPRPECESPFGTELGLFHNENDGRTTAGVCPSQQRTPR